jgi:hypothetical protein
MDKKELYKQKHLAQTREWNARVEGLSAQLAKLTAEAKIEVQTHVDSVHAKFNAAKANLEDIGAAGEEKWDSVTERADSAWLELKACADEAYQAMRRHRAPPKPANSALN